MLLIKPLYLLKNVHFLIPHSWALTAFASLFLFISCGSTNAPSADFFQVALDKKLIPVAGSLNHEELISGFLLTSSDDLVLRNYQYASVSQGASIDPSNLVVFVSATPLSANSEAKALTVVSQVSAPIYSQDDESGLFKLYLFPDTDYLIEFYLQTTDYPIYLGALNTADQYKFSLTAGIQSFELGAIVFSEDAISEFSPSENETGSAAEIAPGEVDTSERQTLSAAVVTPSIERHFLELNAGEAQSLAFSEFSVSPAFIIASAQVPSFVSVEKDDAGTYQLSIAENAPEGEYRFSLIGLGSEGEYEKAFDVLLSLVTEIPEAVANP